MNKRAIKFRDVWVAPGSECFAALEAGDTARADRIYRQCEIDKNLREHRPASRMVDRLSPLLLKRPCPVINTNNC